MIHLVAVLIGVVAGLRALLPLAAVSVAAAAGRFSLANTPLAFFGYRWTPWILSLLALGELINDKRASTPSRKVPMQFGTRVLTGALAAAALECAAAQPIWVGALLGAIGAVAGTLGGAALRGRMARSFNSDLPAALIEDGVALVGGILLVRSLS